MPLTWMQLKILRQLQIIFRKLCTQIQVLAACASSEVPAQLQSQQLLLWLGITSNSSQAVTRPESDKNY
jgi:hypothetical protein